MCAVTPLSDPIDRRIAAALLTDGRSTLKTLAELTGLSVSAVQARVRRLEAEGVIRGYAALIEPEPSSRRTRSVCSPVGSSGSAAATDWPAAARMSEQVATAATARPGLSRFKVPPW